MKTSKILLLLIATWSANLHASEAEPIYIEEAKLLLNITKEQSQQGNILAYRCEKCPAETISINENTLFYKDGRPTTPDQLGLKIDWQGSIFYLPGSPNVATEVFVE